MIQLPDSVKSLLVDLRASKPQDLYNYVKKLREAQWPLRSIAEVLSVSRTAVAKWESQGVSENAPEVPELPLVAPHLRTRTSTRYTLTDDEKAELRELTTQSRLVRRYTDQNSPHRLSSKNLTSLLADYRDRGATLRDLATICGISRASISERLRNEP